MVILYPLLSAYVDCPTKGCVGRKGRGRILWGINTFLSIREEIVGERLLEYVGERILYSGGKGGGFCFVIKIEK